MNDFLAPIIVGIVLLGVCFVSVYRASKFDFRCTHCKSVFRVNPLISAFAPQSSGKKYLLCPACKRKYLCDLILKGKK